jgi:hypothetical protein
MSTHHVKHRWKNEIIVPLIALSDNIDFLTLKEDKTIITADGVQAKVNKWEEIHICALDDLTKRLYGMSAWDFMLRWYNNGDVFYTAYFVYIKSEKT